MRHRDWTFLKNRIRELIWTGVFAFLFGHSLAYGLAIQEIQVRSSLGQRLDASIAVHTSAGERVARECFSLRPPAQNDSLPNVPDPRLRFQREGDNALLSIRSTAVVREPLSQLALQVRCPGLPNIDRTFMVMLDPPAQAESDTRDSFASRGEPATPLAASRAPGAPDPVRAADSSRTTTRQGPATSRPAAGAAADRRVGVATVQIPVAAIAPNSTYRVQAGDMLSTIASRVQGRPVGSVWQIAGTIFASNPGAFLGNDPDRLVAGVQIRIPALNQLATTQAREPAPVPVASAPVAAVPIRDKVPMRRLRTFVFTTGFSGASQAKLQLRRSDLLRAGPDDGAVETQQPQPEPEQAGLAASQAALAQTGSREPLAGTDDPVARSAAAALQNTNDAIGEDAGPTPADAETATTGVAQQEFSAQAAAGDAPAPDVAAAPGTPDLPAGKNDGFGFWTIFWMVAGILGAALTAAVLIFIPRLRENARDRDRVPIVRLRRGREDLIVAPRVGGTAIAVDGIIVDESPSHTDTVANLRPEDFSVVASADPGEIAAAAADAMPEAEAAEDTDQRTYGGEDAGDRTTKIESPVHVLDLELPELELGAGGADDETESMKAPATVSFDSLADSREVEIDTDLLELAYKDSDDFAEGLEDIEIGALLEDEELDLSTLPEEPVKGPASSKEYYHLETESLDDGLLEIETDEDEESKIVAFLRQNPDDKESDDDALAGGGKSRG